MMSVPFEIVGLTSASGVLTKRISLGDDGSLVSDGSACVMGQGAAKRVRLPGISAFADWIGGLKPSEAIALGALHHDLPDEVQITTARKLAAMNGTAPRHLIARTAGHIGYLPKQPALVLLDFDTKGMPQAVADRVKALGGFWTAVVSVAPDLEHAAKVVRRSTSSGIVRSDTGEALKGSDGLHAFVLVQDGADIERFLRTLHDRCWLAGLGWMMVGAGGQLLERSIVDRMVYAAERLVFEGAPLLMEPLAQDAKLRAPAVSNGEPANTSAACRVLSMVEKATLAERKGAERHRLGKDVAQVRAKFIKDHSARIAARFGGSPAQAERTVQRFCEGVLLPNVELPFDAEDMAGATVRDVLADPDRFVDATLADPLEGVDYGRCKAKIMRRPDGTLWINSFAHGRTAYELKHDAASVEKTMLAADPAEAADVLVRLLLLTDLPPDDEQRLRDLATKLSDVKARPLGAKIKQARAEQAQQHARAERDRATATRARDDRRKRLPVPAPDAERLPILEALDDLLCAVDDPEPPMRDLEGRPVEIRSRLPMMLHELTSGGSNKTEPEKARLPAPAMPLLTPHDRYSLAHQIEQHIEFVSEGGDDGPRSVALPPTFVDHFMAYRDSALPRVGAVVTAPLVLSDGSMLALSGLDRDRKLVFCIPPELRAILPKPQDPIPQDKHVAKALSFLVNEWLCDVATDFAGKCVLIALALSILERVLLPERPAFFVTAGKRGGGKTTALAMVILAITGKKPAAAAWSFSEDERRKALAAYLSEGLAAMVFDNIPLGATIACPTIEKILTAESYSDRILGQTAIVTVPAFTILTLTGNNIGPKGDLASRSLMARLDVDRPDPENRPFKHSDPIAWTLCNRGQILRALYVLLLGNPQLKTPKAPRTRFKRWWHLVGSAVENAAACLAKAEQSAPPEADRAAAKIDFVKLFASVEGDDEEASDLADALDILYSTWPTRAFQASEVARLINAPMEGEAANSGRLRTFFDSSGRRNSGDVSAIMVGKRLSTMVDAPVLVGDQTMKLVRNQTDNPEARRSAWFKVRVL